MAITQPCRGWVLEETPFWPKREGSLLHPPLDPQARKFQPVAAGAKLAWPELGGGGSQQEKAMGQTVGTSAQQTGVYLVKIHTAVLR